MPLVRIKTKFQVTLPTALRNQMGVKVGDLLEAKVEKGKMTLIPKTVIDRGIAESLEDYGNGRSYGLFDSAEELLASLHRNLKKVKRRSSARARS